MPFFYTNYKPHKESYQYPLKGIARGLTCTVHFSNRKSISIQVKEDLSIHAKAPFYAKPRDIETFIDAHSEWIYDKHTMLATKLAAKPRLSEAQQKHADTLERKFRKAAKEYIPYRVEYFHKYTGGHYASITIRDQKSRWGSCSSHGTLSFNYRLMMAPPHILDYVVVHELCHLTHMNHSKEFWSMVESILPDYKECKKWLKEHGNELTIEHYMLKSK